MTLRIESVADEHGTTIRLIGRMQAQHVEELKAQMAQIGASGARVALDLRELSLVDVDAVRFLGTCQAGGISIVHCPPYINDWIAKELGRDT
jgi:anti-anti-sigma regulatory factor